MPYFEQNSRDTGGRGHGDTFMHPFKVLVGNNKAYVWPGFVYTNANGRKYDKNDVKIGSNVLGNPFTGTDLQSLTLSDGVLWVKVTFNAAGQFDNAVIEYKDPDDAIDTVTVKYVRLAQTTGNLVEQYLYDNVFVESEFLRDFTVTAISETQITITGGLLYRSEFTEWSWSEDKVFDYFTVDGTIIGATNADVVYLKVEFNKSSMSGPGDAGSAAFYTDGSDSFDLVWTTQLKYDLYTPISGSFVVTDTEPTLDAGTAYFKLADISVVSGKLVVKQTSFGPVIVPVVVVPGKVTLIIGQA